VDSLSRVKFMPSSTSLEGKTRERPQPVEIEPLQAEDRPRPFNRSGLHSTNTPAVLQPFSLCAKGGSPSQIESWSRVGKGFDLSPSSRFRKDRKIGATSDRAPPRGCGRLREGKTPHLLPIRTHRRREPCPGVGVSRPHCFAHAEECSAPVDGDVE